MPKIHSLVPCLWFDTQAEDAAKLYTSIFENSRIGHITRYGEAGQEIHGKKPGSVLTVEFEIDGHPFTALNGGPLFKFTEAISFQVLCETQAEIDYFWDKLSAGGDKNAQQCGWLKDKFGLSWQVVPASIGEMMRGDPVRARRAMQAIMTMVKIDTAILQRAYDGE